MNIDLLKLVRDEIAAADDAKLNMNKWASHAGQPLSIDGLCAANNPAVTPECATCGCLAGWTVFTAKKHGLSVEFDRHYYFQEACRLLGIGHRDGHVLFEDSKTYDKWELSAVTKADVLKKLDELLEEREAKA